MDRETLEERRAVLARLHAAMRAIGSANDALDRGYTESAEAMHREADATVAEALAEHAWLADSYPRLAEELRSPQLRTFGWSRAEDQLAAAVRRLDEELEPRS